MIESFKMNGNLFIVDAITQYENAAVVRFHSATDIYSVYEWTMEAVIRAMDGN